jgi:UPF0755 protein
MAGGSLRKSIRRSLVVILAGMSVLVAGAIAFLLYAFYWPNTFDHDVDKVVFVSHGETFTRIVDTLEAAGVIRDRRLFVLVANLRGGTSRIHVAKYRFKSGISNDELFAALRNGKETVPISVTIPEGLTIHRQARIFAHVLGVDSARYVREATDPEFTHHLGFPDSSLEGYLMPDTYLFNWQTDERSILRELAGSFQRFFVDSLKRRAGELGMSVREIVTMASIVEGETRLEDERAVVAGVYYNRLRLGMKLEADPTIQFLLPDGPRRLLYDDLRLASPYNTYEHAGLPPGPINSPGRLAILAALYPAHHQYLYFVANGGGGHWFSTTYAEHLRRVRMARHLRALAERVRRSGQTGGSTQQ